MRPLGLVFTLHRRKLALALTFSALAAGCAGREPERPPVPPPPPPSTTPNVVAAPPTVDAGPEPLAVATPDAAAPEPAPVPIAPPAKLIDPKTISGAVMSRRASDDYVNPTRATVSGVELGKRKDWYETWDLAFDATDGKKHTIEVIAPQGLPPPLVVGDRVTLQMQTEGGGPNTRWQLVVQANDGSLLLAVNRAPSDWTISQGKPGSVDRGSSYDTQSYGAKFEHAGKRADVASGKWARFDADGTTYYLWGSGASRKLHAGKRPMPDYVGGWLDFAIVRAR